MTWRIENTNTLTTLQELPGNLAQTAIILPPTTITCDQALLILGEIHRVLRTDGTLWFIHDNDDHGCNDKSVVQEQVLQAIGFISADAPDRRITTRLYGGKRFSLFSKQDHYFYDAPPFHRPRIGSSPSPSCLQGRQSRSGACDCVIAREYGWSRRLLRQCILAGSSPVACRACGAPYRRIRPGESAAVVGMRQQRRSTCQHNDPGGRCLVLDPFYDPSIPTAEIALRAGRSFLGITNRRSRTGESR